jgi:hypothetical protein
VGGEDGIGLAGGEELVEGGVAEVAGGLFERLAGGGDAGGDVGPAEMQRDFEAGAEVGDEGGVGVGFGGAEVVVDVYGGEHRAQRLARLAVGRVEGEEEGDGVGTAGDGAAEAVAGAEVFAGEGKHRYEFTWVIEAGEEGGSCFAHLASFVPHLKSEMWGTRIRGSGSDGCDDILQRCSRYGWVVLKLRS